MPHSGRGWGHHVIVSKGTGKYRDIDEDEILKTLSPEELEQLDCELQEMDPRGRGSSTGIGQSLGGRGGRGPDSETRSSTGLRVPRSSGEQCLEML